MTGTSRSARILIVGRGYLGTRLASRLAQARHTVFATNRSAQQAEVMGLQPHVVGLALDLRDRSQIERLPEVDALVCCVSPDPASLPADRAGLVRGVLDLVALTRARVGRFVLVSTTSVYGHGTAERIDEESPLVPETDSARAAAAAEEAVLSTFSRPGSAVIARLSGLYGPGRIIRRDALVAGRPIAADPRGWLNLIHVDDAAAALEGAITYPEPALPTVFNVNDDDPGPRARYYGLAARLLHAPEPRFTDEAGGEGPAPRVIDNQRMKRWLLPQLAFPSIATGLPAAIAAEGPSTGASH